MEAASVVYGSGTFAYSPPQTGDLLVLDEANASGALSAGSRVRHNLNHTISTGRIFARAPHDQWDMALSPRRSIAARPPIHEPPSMGLSMAGRPSFTVEIEEVGTLLRGARQDPYDIAVTALHSPSLHSLVPEIT